MMEQFERVNKALDRLEEMLSGMKAKNDTLCREIAELKGIIEDRDLEIMQLQEDAEKLAAASQGRKGRAWQLPRGAPRTHGQADGPGTACRRAKSGSKRRELLTDG